MTKKIMISLPPDFLAEVDIVAQEEHRNRSELFREALRQYIEMRRKTQIPRNNPRIQSAVEIQNKLSELNNGSGEDSTAEIRRWREYR